MQRKWLIGGLAAVVVAGVLLGGQLLMTHRVTGSAADMGPQGSSSTATSDVSADASDQASASTSSEASQVALQAPKVPAALGESLKTLAAPPAKTAGGFAATFLPPGSRYSVTVQPYGYGPAQGPYATLIVLISTAKGLDGAAGADKLVGRNALALVESGKVGAYAKGGSFSAELTLKPDPRGSVLVLSVPRLGAAPKK
jgi:hypothetical protein